MVAAVLNWFAEFIRAHEAERLQRELTPKLPKQVRPNPGLDITPWLSQRSE